MNLRTLAPVLTIVALTVFATAFGLINYSNTVKVWPLMSYQPLTLVIGVSFLLGAGVSGLLVHLLSQRRVSLEAVSRNETPVQSLQEREHATRQ